MPEPLTGLAAELGLTLGDAATRKGAEFWRRNHEGDKLVRKVAARVKADAAVHHSVREPLAKLLPDKLRTEPQAQGALALLLDGERMDAAAAALAQVTVRLVTDEVAWPEEFSPQRFGEILVGHAVEEVNRVKATDREAAHVDAKYTRERIARVPGEVVVALREDLRASAAALPLVPPFSPGADSDTAEREASLLEMLRASERRFPLVGRAEVMERAEAWLLDPPTRQGPDHRVAIIHGPGGAGKTRLAAEVMAVAQRHDWIAGFLASRDPNIVDWVAMSHPTVPLAIAIDYSEARRNDLQRLFQEAPVGREGTAPLRIILIVREGKAKHESWLDRFSGPWDLGRRAGELLAEGQAEVISLEESLPDPTDRRDLWAAAQTALGGSAEPPDYLSGPLFERPLYILLDASRHLVRDGVSDASDARTPSARELLDGVLRHERKYWTEARRELGLELDERRVNLVATVATLVGGVQRQAFEETLTALPWLAQDDDLRSRVADWWSAVYATGSGAVRGIEPDIVGEYQVVRALEEPLSPRDQLGGSMPIELLTSFVAAAPPNGRQRILRVLTRIATSHDSPGVSSARAVLTEVLSQDLDQLLPRAFADAELEAQVEGGLGESLATTVASAVLAAEALDLVTPNPTEREMRTRAADDVGEAARDAALQLVRRQIERVAAREYEARHWSLDRYLEIVAWAVQLDLRSGHEGQAMSRIAEVDGLSPRPHRALAQLLLLAGRHREADRRWGEAESLYTRALEELQAAGEEDSVTAYVIWHDLGDVARGRREHELAIDRLERSLEGKTRLRGPSDPDTLNTFRSLVRAVAVVDVERACTMLEEELEAVADAPEQQLTLLRGYRPYVMLAAGRAAEADKKRTEAEDLYQRGLDELKLLDEEDSILAYVLWHDLGDVASARGDHQLALERFERALDGKMRLRGPLDPDTMTTLVAVIEETAAMNVDRALARVKTVVAMLKDAGADPEALMYVSATEMEILQGARRFDDAVAVARRMLEERIASDVRRAVLQAAADPTPDEDVEGASAAVRTCLLAARLFGPGDIRLPALASRLTDVLTEVIGQLVASQMQTSDLATFDDDEDGGWSLDPAKWSREARTELVTKVPNVQEFVTEGLSRLETALDQVAADPAFGSLLQTPDPAGYLHLREDRAVQRWLVRTAFAQGANEASQRVSLAALLSFNVGLGLGLPPDELLDPVAIWTRPESEALAEREQGRLIEAVQATASLNEPSARRLTTAARAEALAAGAEGALKARRVEEAEDLLTRAQEASNEIGEGDTLFAFLLVDGLAQVALLRGEHSIARERLKRSLEGKVRFDGGFGRPGTLLTLERLVSEIARTDVDEALALLARAAEDLSRTEAISEASARVALDQVQLLVNAGRFTQADVAARHAQKIRVARGVRQAVEEAAENPVADEATATALAVDACILGARVFPPGDPRLPGFASRLVEVIGGVTGTLVMSRLPMSRAIEFFKSAGIAIRPGASSSDLARQIADADLDTAFSRLLGEASDIDEFVDVSLGIVIEQVAQIAAEITNEPETMLDGGRLAGLADDRAVTAWLARTVLVGMPGENERRSGAGSVLSFYVGLRRDAIDQPPLRKSLPEIWGLPDADGIPAAARTRLAAALRSAGDLDEAEAERLVLAGQAHALSMAGREAESRHRWDEAEGLYTRALDLLKRLEEQDSRLAYTLWHDLGDVARGRDDHNLALERYERAFEGRTRLLELWDEDRVVSLLSLLEVLARVDRNRALVRLDEVSDQLSAAPAAVAALLREHRPAVIHAAGRAAEHESRWAEAETLYTRALDELEAIDERESPLAYVIIHDLGDVASGRGDHPLALARLEQALEGKTRVRGPGDDDTITTLLRLASEIAISDLGAARDRVNQATMDLPDDADALRRVRAWLHDHPA